MSTTQPTPPTQAPQTTTKSQLPPLITLEEHYISPLILQNPNTAKWYTEQFKAIPTVQKELEDLGPLRLKSMNENDISLQVISHAPTADGGPSLEECREANDRLYKAIVSQGESGDGDGDKQREGEDINREEKEGRFAGFAVLPMSQPQQAAMELQRCAKDLHFVGALVDNHSNGDFYDTNAYHIFWKIAQDLNMPIYLHPTWPSPHLNKSLFGENIPEAASRSLGASGWGWHTETGLHILRLFAAGIFDLFPKLKVVIGHFGEMVPFMLERINKLSKRWGDRQRDFQQCYRENVWITVSGVWSLAPMGCILRNTPVSHVLFSIDWPFERNENGRKWVEDLRESGMVTEEEFEMICYKNAEGLLGIKAPKS